MNDIEKLQKWLNESSNIVAFSGAGVSTESGIKDFRSKDGLYNQKYLSSWLITITLIRNIIAHHGRLWNRVIINKYDWPKKTMAPLLNYVPNNYQRRKIFPILSAILYLNNFISPGHSIKTELLALFKKFHQVPLYKMGFPKGWQQQPIWKN